MVKFRFICILTLGLLFQYSGAQQNNVNITDSLDAKSFKYLINAVNLNDKDSIRAHIYLDAWLLKAKLQANQRQLAAVYKILISKSPRQFRLAYADSMVVAARKTNDDLLIGTAYLAKGVVHYDRKELKIALDNYLQADNYISRTNNNDATYMVKYSIALTKYHIGFYDEAIALFTQCMKYYSEENDRAYLNTVHSLGICYNKMGDFEKCSLMNATGLKASEDFEITEMIPYFINSEGINQFSKGKYSEAIKMLLKSIPTIKKKKDFANESISWFYVGKSYWKLGQHEKAIGYFNEVDQIFQIHNYMREDIRESYELLIEYYKINKKQQAELIYVKKLLKVNQFLNDNKYYLSHKIIKEYDNTKLLATKAAIENSLQIKNNIKSIIIISMLFIAVIMVYRYFTFRKKYRKKFQELMTKTKKQQKTDPISMKEALSDINPEVIETVIKNMHRFEQKKEFLQKDLTQVKLATLLETNTRYIPKIVLHATGKTTIDYMCDLKIEYLLERLKIDSRIRNYTQKALGEEVGFGSTQNFTRAFKSCTGMSPTLFIAELKRESKDKD